MRLGGLYLALATFALAVAMPQMLKYKLIEPLTGGVQGIVLSKPDPPFELHLFDQPLSADRWLFIFTLLVGALMFWLAWNLLRGRVGRALVAIRDHPIAASAMGIMHSQNRSEGKIRRSASVAHCALQLRMKRLLVPSFVPTLFTSISSCAEAGGAKSSMTTAIESARRTSMRSKITVRINN